MLGVGRENRHMYEDEEGRELIIVCSGLVGILLFMWFLWQVLF